MRELNALNKTILQKFASRQAYTQIKGHYIPIIWTDITDESVMEVDKRKYYIQTYEFTMMGFLIDEEQFEVSPAISRTFQVIETDQRNIKRKQKKKEPFELASIAFEYKKLLSQYAIKTGTPPDFVRFQAHDFSLRGMSNLQDAAMSGAGHLTSFYGTDSVPAIDLLENYYHADASKEINKWKVLSIL